MGAPPDEIARKYCDVIAGKLVAAMDEVIKTKPILKPSERPEMEKKAKRLLGIKYDD